MKVVSSSTMRNLDRETISQCGISGLELMENAARSCTDVIVREFGQNGPRRVVILAGKGNNGGDGFVIARHLSQIGWSVNALCLAERSQIGGDAGVNLNLLPDELLTCCAQPGLLTKSHRDMFSQADLIVDALLGTGLNSEVGGIYREAVDLINGAKCPVVAVDIPSGIHGSTGEILGCAVRADITVTFACPKLGHVLYPGVEHLGRLIVTDIGIPSSLIDAAPGYEFLDKQAAAHLLRRRDRQGHKGNYGHCLIIAGATGKTGAASLSANAAVRAGSGLVTLAVPENLHQILELKTTEAMTVPLPDSRTGCIGSAALPRIMELLPHKDALAVGPGIGRHPGTSTLVHSLLESATIPVVIDADGLNALTSDLSVLKRKKTPTLVLTPHPGEMARLINGPVPGGNENRITVARDFAQTHGLFLVLKGARTIIAAPDGSTAINGSGNPGMASGGMGDVLTGIIVSLLGQGYPAWDACRLGVFVHGFAADLVAGEKGEIGLTATDVQEMLPRAYKRLFSAEDAPISHC